MIAKATLRKLALKLQHDAHSLRQDALKALALADDAATRFEQEAESMRVAADKLSEKSAELLVECYGRECPDLRDTIRMARAD